MKSKNEVLRMLQDCEDELRDAKEWIETARKNYENDRLFFEDANNDELLTAKNNYYSVKKMMELLMNILEIHTEADK